MLKLGGCSSKSISKMQHSPRGLYACSFMDPVFRFYAGPNQSGAGRGSGSRSIPVYEGYGILSSLANRLFYPVLRNAGRDLLARGLTYLADPESRKARKRGEGFDYGAEEEADEGLSPPAPKRRRRRSRARKKLPTVSGGGAISKTRRRRRGKQLQAGRGGRRARIKKARKGNKHKKRGNKAGASRSLFHLFGKKKK